MSAILVTVTFPFLLFLVKHQFTYKLACQALKAFFLVEMSRISLFLPQDCVNISEFPEEPTSDWFICGQFEKLQL